MWVRKLLFLAASALLLLVFAYDNHYKNGFHFDDPSIIENNVSIRDLSQTLPILTDARTASADTESQIYRPLATLSLALDYARGALKVNYYRRTAFDLYLIQLLLMFFLFRELLRSSLDEKTSAATALFATALYALHGVNAETINYLSARGVLLGSLFSVMALLLYVRRGWTRERRIYLLPLACAVLSSQDSVMVVVIIFLHHLLFDSEPGEPEVRRIKRALIAALPSAMVALCAFALVETLSLAPTRGPLSIDYLLTQPYVFANYTSSFFYPIGISAEYGVSPFRDALNWKALCGLVFSGSILVLAVLSLRQSRTCIIGFGILWYIFALLPSSSVFEYSTVIDYRRTFFPYIGLTLSVGAGIALALQKARSSTRWKTRHWSYVTAVLLVVLAVNILVIRQRNRTWRNEETLWFDVIAKNPGYGRAYMNYGLSKMAKNDFDIARIYLEQALVFMPDSPQLYTDLGTLHGTITKDISVAESYFTKAMALAPNYAPAYLAYGRWLLSRKKYERAISEFQRAEALDSNPTQARYGLMEAYFSLMRWANVREIARLVLEQEPNNETAKDYLTRADSRPKRASGLRP